MSPGRKLISGIVLSLIVCPWSAAALPDTVRGVKVSGGEERWDFFAFWCPLIRLYLRKG
jgi:hypothetical protein